MRESYVRSACALLRNSSSVVVLRHGYGTAGCRLIERKTSALRWRPVVAVIEFKSAIVSYALSVLALF